MIEVIVNRLKEKVKELKSKNISENDIFKIVTDFLTDELRSMSVNERERFFISFERDRKLKEILEDE